MGGTQSRDGAVSACDGGSREAATGATWVDAESRCCGRLYMYKARRRVAEHVKGRSSGGDVVGLVTLRRVDGGGY